MTDKGFPMDPALIRAAARSLKQEERLRPRDIADRLGISEALLLAAEVGIAGSGIVRLVDDLASVLRQVPRLGTVMALTRNEAAVHEKVGPYGEVRLFDGMGGVFGKPIDLRFFMGHWHFGFALDEPGEDGAPPKRSLQFFDADGMAVHKVHLRPESDHAAFADIVSRFQAPSQEPGIRVALPAKPRSDRDDGDVDRAALRARWQALADVHQFHGMLRDLDIGRQQSFRLIGRDLAWPVAADSFRPASEQAAAAGVPIMVFVPNAGCIQIHSGPIERLKAMGSWWNILDPGFNLHLRQDLVASAWVVQKPTGDGPITSLELFDAHGRLLLMMFGERERGAHETEAWRRIATSLDLVEAGS